LLTFRSLSHVHADYRPIEVRLPEGIAGEIAAAGGRVTFARFMELALTHPSEGYYARAGGRDGPLLGRRGHFSTVPHLSPAFCRSVARLLAELVDASLAAAPLPPGRERSVGAMRSPVAVIELGGGEGDLAAGVMTEWQRTRGDLRGLVVYNIVEIGPALRARQRETTAELAGRGWEVRWADDLRGAAYGTRPVVVLGNEFIDALPVHVIDVRGSRPLEAWIGPGGAGRVTECWEGLSPEAAEELDLLFAGADCDDLRSLSRDGFIELRAAVPSLLAQLAAIMGEGCLLTIDYGGWFPGAGSEEGPFWSRLCHPCTRSTHGRTLRGYFRHQLVADPYARVGHQDLTADVDFRALDLHGRAIGFETVLYTSLAALLQAGGGTEELEALRKRAADSLEADREASVLAALLDNEDVGGAFKVMLQVRER